MKTISIGNTINELYRIFSLLNEKFFDKKLEEPIILIQSKRKMTLGSCSVNRVWEHKETDKSPKKYEITISAEHLNRTIEEIVATLLHEMIHLYCSVTDIKETSNNHVYHNKKFKIEAEKRGLIISHAESIGWSITTLQDSTKDLIKTFKVDETVFEYYRKSLSFSSLPKTPIEKTPRNKYICKCGTKLSSKKELNITCGDCNSPFDKVN